jgi:predicted enzyme related to lactoylglutathione lyase
MNSPAANPVIHLELHTGDLRGAVAFYQQLFGWRPERIRAGAGSYLALGMGNGVGGGVVECEAKSPLWLPYVDVPDVGATTERARGLGGEVLLGPREGPDGWRSVVSTPDGGEVAFWQSKNGH